MQLRRRPSSTICLVVFALREPQNSSEPQGTFDAAYQSCLSTLGKSIAPGLAQAADILMVANRTGVDPKLRCGRQSNLYERWARERDLSVRSTFAAAIRE